jgi:hypothetical protein
MVAFVKYNVFAEDLCNKLHDIFGTTDTLRVALSNAAPNVATHVGLADITDLTTTGGYTAGGEDTQNDATRSSGTVTVTGIDVTWTASGGGFGPFRYVILYNDTSTGDRLIGYWDYTSSITLVAGETFKADFGASMFTVV